MLGKRLLTSLAAGMLMAAAGTAGAAANFDADVATSIDKGLAWFDAAGCYGGTDGATFSCGNATGLALLALLEKRPSADASPQGYAGASAIDQDRMRRTMQHVITSISAQGDGFYAYRDGAYMMALSVYMRSGGPEIPAAPLTLKGALDKAFDRTIANQRKGLPDEVSSWPENNGYWCYYNNGCRDSSTTQLVVAGLAAARAAYLTIYYSDEARLAQLNAAAALARTAYERNGTSGGSCTSAENERGHGYNAGSHNSIQQTASGLWIQLVGNAKLNDAGVQGYLRWLQQRYRYSNIATGDGIDGYWGDISYRYYLWSSFKAFQFLVDSKETPTEGNIGVADIGMLPPADAPACASRQQHLVPTALPRIGGGSVGYYGDETPRIYFDYAYSLMTQQCPDGSFFCAVGSGWDEYADQAYSLLVLQRSVGGGCIVDSEGKCPALPPPVPPSPSSRMYCDKNGNGTVDNSDLSAIWPGLIKFPNQPAYVKVDANNAWANYFQVQNKQYGDEKNYITFMDYTYCKAVKNGDVAKKYY
jgi:hypothetical protein